MELQPRQPLFPPREGKVSNLLRKGSTTTNIDNDAGADWEPTDDPEPEVTPVRCAQTPRKSPADSPRRSRRAEVQEAEEQSQQNRVGVMATPTNRRTYRPSPYKVCGEIRKKYDAEGRPRQLPTGPPPTRRASPTVSDGATSSSTASSTGTRHTAPTPSPPTSHTSMTETAGRPEVAANPHLTSSPHPTGSAESRSSQMARSTDHQPDSQLYRGSSTRNTRA